MIFQNLILAAATSITLIACGNTEPKQTSTEETVTETTDNQSATASDFVSGLTDANKDVVRGDMELTGSFKNNVSNVKMYLYETEGKQNFLIDSTVVEGNAFSFAKREYESGFYMLALKNSLNMVGIIMNPTEKAVNIAFATGRLENSASSATSKENIGWFEYLKAENAAEAKKKGYRSSAKDSPMKAKFEKLMEEEDEKLTALQKDMIQRYPGTYLAKLMTWKQTPYKSDKSKYWSDLNFEDPSIIHSPVIPDRIQEYMRAFSGGTEDGFMNAVDLVAQASGVWTEASDGESELLNAQVYSFTILTMLEGFYSSGKEVICSYIMDSYVYGENCGSGDYAEEMKNRASGIKNLAIGSVPPDFTIEKWDGGKVNLQSEVQKHEYTLVMFWSSWCHKCEQEIPTLKVLYDQYKAAGFGVIGVSVDSERSAWVRAVEEKGATWPNVSQLDAWNSPVAKDYRVSQTPTLFLLNSDREIVLKPERIFHIRDFLSKNLK
jgi:peroxiredoxin